MARPRFRIADIAQQTVGGFLLAGPFVVTEEVWVLATNMTLLHAVLAVGIVAGIGYGTLYEADTGRDPDAEPEVVGVPLRFLSLMAVAYGSVTVLALVFTAPRTFLPAILADAGVEPTTTAIAVGSAKAVSVGAIFSVVGAATADSVF